MERIVPWALAAASGVALALALPGLAWWPLTVAAPALLLEALRDAGPKRALALGWFAGAVHWAVAVSWVVPVMSHYGGLPGPLAVVALAFMGLVLGAFWAVPSLAAALARPALRPWLLPAAWIALDPVRALPPFQFPWNTVAAAFAGRPELLGSLPVWGASGLGWATLAVGAGLWAAARRKTRRSGAAVAATAVALVALATALAPPADEVGEPVRVALIQPGTSQEERWDPDEWAAIAARVRDLTVAAAADRPDLVLWPEGATAYRIDADLGFASQLVELAAALDADLLLNAVGGSQAAGWSNSAYLVQPAGVSPVRYDKVRLVPFGEYIPGWARLAFTDALVREVAGFRPGSSVTLLPARRATVGMAICYEVVFPEHVAAEVRQGAELLATLTNDGWYGFSWAPRQHFAQVVLRAVESRRWFVRAALTGISAAVDPRGRVHGRLEVGAAGRSVVDVRRAAGLTPRARWGDWWAVLCAAVTLLLLVHGWRRKSLPAGDVLVG